MAITTESAAASVPPFSSDSTTAAIVVGISGEPSPATSAFALKGVAKACCKTAAPRISAAHAGVGVSAKKSKTVATTDRPEGRTGGVVFRPCQLSKCSVLKCAYISAREDRGVLSSTNIYTCAWRLSGTCVPGMILVHGLGNMYHFCRRY